MATDVHITRLTKTPIGCVLLAATRSGIVRVSMSGDDEALRASLERQFPGVRLRRPSTLTTETGRAVRAYLGGREATLEVPVVLPEEGFGPRVWRHLARIPRGQVRTYGAVARALRKRGAARAVGQACGRNPVPLLRPCHRVVAADRSLGGFMNGADGALDIKRYLLTLEGVDMGSWRASR